MTLVALTLEFEQFLPLEAGLLSALEGNLSFGKCGKHGISLLWMLLLQRADYIIIWCLFLALWWSVQGLFHICFWPYLLATRLSCKHGRRSNMNALTLVLQYGKM